MPVTSDRSSESQALIQSFRDNEFDIAGLADLPDNARALDHCLQLLYRIVRSERSSYSATEAELAQTLFALLRVAQSEYATEGWSEFWPFLFDRIQAATFSDQSRSVQAVPRNQRAQQNLGSWARKALVKFDYSVPRSRQVNIDPIIFHCGLPDIAISRLLGVLARGYEVYGDSLAELPVDLRRQLIELHISGLGGIPKKTCRFLQGESLGAAELWACLSRVIVAWKRRGAAALELQLLPSGINVDLVQEAIEALPTGRTSRARHRAFPEIRFRPETGNVVLSVPFGGSADWGVSDTEALYWRQTNIGSTAFLQRPLPPTVSVTCHSQSGLSRVFHTHQSGARWLWFHGHNGNLEDSEVIESRGIGPGRWYVLVEGTPDPDSSPGILRQLTTKWRWFADGKTWTAWEVRVPSRSIDCEALTLTVDGEEISIDLARRPGSQVEMPSPLFTAETAADHKLIDIYEEPPLLRTESTRSVSLLLIPEFQNGQLGDPVQVDVSALSETLVPIDPACGPGVYQLREARGVGRLISRFAVVPGFAFDGPEYDEVQQTAKVEVLAPHAGHLNGSGISQCDGIWIIGDSTVQPALQANWNWHNESVPTILLSWPVEGVRWRVVSQSDSEPHWTNEVILIDKRDANGALLEIEVPFAQRVQIGDRDITDNARKTESGLRIEWKLDSVDQVIFQTAGEEHVALVKVDRPIVAEFAIEQDDDTFQISARLELANKQACLIAWDPLQPSKAPKLLERCDKDGSSIDWIGSASDLPIGRQSIVAIACEPPRGLSLKKPARRLAVRNDSLRSPVWSVVDQTADLGMNCVREVANNAYLLGWLVDGLKDYRKELFSDLIRFVRSSWSDRVGEFAPLEAVLSPWIQGLSNACDELLSFGSQFQSAIRIHQLREPCQLFKQLKTREERDEASVRLLIEGRHFADFDVNLEKWLPSIGTAADQMAFPIDYIRDLWLICNNRKQRVTKTAAWRRLDVEHQRIGIPELLNFHPLRIGKIKEFMCDRSKHWHQLTAERLQGFGDGSSDFRLTAKGGHGAPGRTNGTNSYTLEWSAEKARWSISGRQESGCVTSCTCTGPLKIAPVSINQIERLLDLNLREKLIEWDDESPTEQVSQLDLDFCVPSEMSPIARQLCEVVLKPAKQTTKQLFGAEFITWEVPEISGCMRDIWIVCLMDRLTAADGPELCLGTDDFDAPVVKELYRQLGLVLQAAPTKARKCLILAELFTQTLYRGGIGTLANFPPPEEIT